MAVSLVVARLGPGPQEAPSRPLAELPAQDLGVGTDLGEAAGQVLVRTVAAADGSAAFVVRATRLPARVRVAVAGHDGSRVVRGVVVRSRDGRRLVVTGLDGGTYVWSATSPAAPRVTGEVRVAAQAPALVVAAQEPRGVPSASPTPPPQPAVTPAAQASQPTSQPTQQPTQQPTAQPSPQPTQQPTRPRPSDSPGEPTDPATQDPGPVG